MSKNMPTKKQFRSSLRKSAVSRKPKLAARPAMPFFFRSFREAAAPVLVECLEEGGRDIVRRTAKKLGVREITAARLLDFTARLIDIKHKEDVISRIDLERRLEEQPVSVPDFIPLNIQIGSDEGGGLLTAPKQGFSCIFISGLRFDPTVDSVLMYLEMLSFALKFDLDESAIGMRISDSKIEGFLANFGMTWEDLPLTPSAYARLEKTAKTLVGNATRRDTVRELSRFARGTFTLYGNMLDPDSVTLDATTDLAGEDYKEYLGVNVVSLLITTMRESKGNGWVIYADRQAYRAPHSLTLLTNQSLDDPRIHGVITRILENIRGLEACTIQDMQGNGPILLAEYAALKP